MKYFSIIQPAEESFKVYCDFGQVEELKPLHSPLLIMPDGRYAYLNQNHIDWLLKCEQEEVIKEAINKLFDDRKYIDYYGELLGR